MRELRWAMTGVILLLVSLWIFACGEFGGDDTPIVIPAEQRECPPGKEKRGICVPVPAYVVLSEDTTAEVGPRQIQFVARAYDMWDMEVTAQDTAGTPLDWVWSVLDTLIATVDTTGLVTGLTEGSTTVVVQLDSLADSAVVTVLPPPPPVVLDIEIGWLDPDSLGAWVWAAVRYPTIEPGDTIRFCAAAQLDDGSVGVGNSESCLIEYNNMIAAQQLQQNTFLVMFQFEDQNRGT